MTSLKSASATHLLSKRVLAIIALTVGFFGFLDTAYLSLVRIRGEVPTCTILEGCEVVTTSSYSTLAGIPLAYLGVGYYLAVIALTLLFIDTKKMMVARVLCVFTGGAVAFSLWLLYVQAALIHAYCIYCVSSLIFSTILFGVSARFALLARHAKI